MGIGGANEFAATTTRSLPSQTTGFGSAGISVRAMGFVAAGCGTAPAHWIRGGCEIVEELREKLLRKFRMSPPAVDRAIGTLFDGMEIVVPTALESPSRAIRMTT